MEEKNIKINIPEQKKVTQCVYGVTDFEKLSEKLFCCPSECVTAAFRLAGKKEATEKEAKKIVMEFLNKEVQ